MSLARRLGSRVEEQTLLSYLPPELKEEVYQRAYRCDFGITFVPARHQGNMHSLVLSHGLLTNKIWLRYDAMTKGQLHRLLIHIDQALSASVLGDVHIYYYASRNLIEIHTGESMISFPLCVEFINAMRMFHDSL